MMKKVILRSLVGFAAIIAIFIILMLTPLGLHLSLRFASAILPGKITYDHVTGVITGPIEIRNFKYSDKNNIIVIHDLKFSWRFWQLLHRKINVNHFRANDVRVTLRLKQNAKKSASATPTKPTQFYQLQISNAQVNRLSIGYKPNEYPIFIRRIQLQARIVPQHVNIQSHMQVEKPIPISADLNVNGNLDRYTIYVGAISNQFAWHLYGLGNAQGIFLNLKKGKTFGGTLSFNANIKWAPIIRWDVDLVATDLNLQSLNPDWPQKISATVDTQGKFEKNKPIFQLKTNITAPGANIQLSAQQKDQLHLQWNLNVNNLSVLYKKFTGTINSKGQWTDGTKTPATKGQLQAKNIALLGYSATSFNAQWLLYPDQRRSSNIAIDGTNINAAGLQISRINLQGKGSQTLHQLRGDVYLHGNHLNFQMQGGFANDVWRGKLQKLMISSNIYRNWLLTQPSNIAIAKTQVDIKNLCLRSADMTGSLCVNGNWHVKNRWQFTIAGNQFDPSLFTRFVMPKLILKATSTLQATVTGKGNDFQSAVIDMRLQKGSFRYQLNGNYIASSLQSGNIKLVYRQNKLDVTSQLNLSDKNQVNLSVSIPNFSPTVPPDQQKISGKIIANFGNLTPFSKVLQAIAKPKGELKLNLAIQGPLSAPDVQGKISLYDGSVYLPRLGITLKKVDANITSINQKQLNYTATAYSKGQPIYIKGEAIQTPQGVKSTTHITGNNFLIMNTPQYTIYASPKLTVTIEGYNIELTGSVNIPKGIIQPGEFTNVIKVPSDQIIYTAGEPFLSQSTWHISANVDVTLGDNVVVKTTGFDVTVAGKAKIIGKPRKTTLASGRIRVIKGNYSAYGRTLTISPGSFIEFINSPVNNPTLNIRATRLIRVAPTLSVTQTSLGLNNIIVGISVRGTFRHPKVTFFSIPANLSQADILSYLVLGYASQTASGSNLGLLLEAASALGGKGAGIGGAISEIKQGLGLTELGVETETVLNAIGMPVDQQSAFVIGKRLTKNIYIRYSVGLGQGPFAPVNIFQLRYTFNRHWAVQTEASSLGNGGDILYTIETN